MGRRILTQRRGKGTQNFRSPKHKKKGKIQHLHIPKGTNVKGTIIDFIHEGGRGTPLALIDFENGVRQLWLPPEGMFIGDTIEYGEKTEIAIGNSMQLRNIPEGSLVYNIELRPGDGGKLIRASGTTATVITRTERGVTILLPSGARKMINQMSRATIGIVAGGGKVTRPFMKAGTKWHLMRTKATTWPVVRGCVMNAHSHPFGGGSKHRAGMSTCCSRNAPPGRKVGLIAASQSGRKKR
jgi:large subunit ribosomal protein L2